MKPKPRDEAIWTPRAIRQLGALRLHIGKTSEQNAAIVAERIVGAVDLL